MDVLPAHLNRDSFRDSCKGLVALEIIIDLPIGFPINNIISHLSAVLRDLGYSTSVDRLRTPGLAGFVACTLRYLGSGGIQLLFDANGTPSGFGPILMRSVMVFAFRLGLVRVCGLVFRCMIVLASHGMTISIHLVGLVSILIGLGTADILCHVLRHPHVSVCCLVALCSG